MRHNDAMRFLRHYLMPEFGQATGPALTPDALEAWLGDLPLTKPAEAASALADQAARVRKGESNVRKRIRLYDLIQTTADKVLPLAEEKLGRATLPLTPTAETLREEADRLLRELGHGYTEIAAEVSTRWLGLGFAKPLRAAVLRGLSAHSRRQMLAYRIYNNGSRSGWTAMHKLYRIARDGSFAAEAPEGGGESIQHLYLRSLLMGFADPTRLAAGELDRVRFYIERYGDAAMLTEPGASFDPKAEHRGQFLVRAEDEGPGRSLAKWQSAVPRDGDLILDCRKVQEKLAQHIHGLESNIVPARLGLPIVARHPQYLAMLRNLQRCWGAPAVRRHPRARFHPRIDIAAGFTSVWDFLSTSAYRRRTQERDQVADSPVSSISEWAILNESPGGFAIRLVSDNRFEMRVGELVAARPHERGPVQLCMARRAMSARGRKLEMGLEILASRPVPITITIPDAQAKTKGTLRDVRVVLLLKVPEHDNAPMLVAAPDTLWPGIEFTVRHAGRNTCLRVARRVEKSASAERYLLERGGLTA